MQINPNPSGRLSFIIFVNKLKWKWVDIVTTMQYFTPVLSLKRHIFSPISENLILQPNNLDTLKIGGWSPRTQYTKQNTQSKNLPPLLCSRRTHSLKIKVLL
jgi:hypothetical protein